MNDRAGPTFALLRAAAGALFFDTADRVMLVRPVYKAGLDIPGGCLSPGETPYQACVREVREELGIEPEIGRLLVADWEPGTRDGGTILFVFDGGEIDDGTRSRITFTDGELSGYDFCPPDELDDVLAGPLARRVKAGVVARELGETVYLEYGRAVPPA
ncbi:NUDIX hydrolase [Spongiactinospora rosea]|uniref:NUDIX hydrolase n=1 Tax=Spongiactinospora rosea TaxID=2248750 RepID=A0A366M0K7_9ACTN|nr:NUDIX hydrolase [Spongiactinospora rosea]RBQ19726.1 NUDIX hydrolase [Spongiactinospora rosea]